MIKTTWMDGWIGWIENEGWLGGREGCMKGCVGGLC